MGSLVKNVATARQGKRVQTVIEIISRKSKWGAPSAKVLLFDANGSGKLDKGDKIIEFHRKSGFCTRSSYVSHKRNSAKNYCSWRKVDSYDILFYRSIANLWFGWGPLNEWHATRESWRKLKKEPVRRAYCLPKPPRSRYLAGRYLKQLSRPLTLNRKVAKMHYTARELRRMKRGDNANPSKCASIVVKNHKLSFAGFENYTTLSWNGQTYKGIAYLSMFGVRVSSGAVLMYKDKSSGVTFVHTGVGSVRIQGRPKPRRGTGPKRRPRKKTKPEKIVKGKNIFGGDPTKAQ